MYVIYDSEDNVVQQFLDAWDIETKHLSHYFEGHIYLRKSFEKLQGSVEEMFSQKASFKIFVDKHEKL